MMDKYKKTILALTALWALVLTGCVETHREIEIQTLSAFTAVKTYDAKDTLQYDTQAGHYALRFLKKSDRFSYDYGEYLYDVVAESEVEFGDHNDKMAHFKIPIKVFECIIATDDDKQAIASCNDTILIETPYTIRVWDFSSVGVKDVNGIKYDCIFNETVNGFTFEAGGSEYVLTISLYGTKRAWPFGGRNEWNIGNPYVADGIRFNKMIFKKNGKQIPLAYNGKEIDGYYPLAIKGDWLGDHHPFSIMK